MMALFEDQHNQRVMLRTEVIPWAHRFRGKVCSYEDFGYRRRFCDWSQRLADRAVVAVSTDQTKLRFVFYTPRGAYRKWPCWLQILQGGRILRNPGGLDHRVDQGVRSFLCYRMSDPVKEVSFTIRCRERSPLMPTAKFANKESTSLSSAMSSKTQSAVLGGMSSIIARVLKGPSQRALRSGHRCLLASGEDQTLGRTYCDFLRIP